MTRRMLCATAITLTSLGVAVMLVPTALGAGGTSIAFDSSTWDYGTIDANTTASKTFVLTNSGNAGTGALNVALSGSSAFRKTADSCTGAGLGPRKTCSVTVQYAPTTRGSTDSATLMASGRQAASASVLLTGKSSVPHLTISPTSWDFGTQVSTKAFTVTNEGTASTVINSESASSIFAVAPELDTCSAQSLAPGQSCQVGAIALVPRGCGATYSGSLTVGYDSSTRQASATLTAAQQPCVPHLRVAPTSWDFGTQSGMKTFTFTSDGTAPAEVAFHYESGDFNDFLPQIGTCVLFLVLQPGDTCQASVEFILPEGCGATYSANYSVNYTPVGGGYVQSAGTTLTAAQPPCPAHITVAPSSWDFGAYPGTSHSFTVTNDGGSPALITLLATEPGPFSLGESNCFGSAQQLQPNESCWVNVDFVPLEECGTTTYTNSLTVQRDYGAQTVTVPVTGALPPCAGSSTM